MTIHDNIMNKISFQNPHDTNNIFTQKVLFFQEMPCILYKTLYLIYMNH